MTGAGGGGKLRQPFWTRQTRNKAAPQTVIVSGRYRDRETPKRQLMNPLLKTILAAAALFALSASALAQDAEPLPPEEAYRYVVTDTGDTLEIDWVIEDGYYLYKNKLGFESATGSVTLGQAEMPKGLDYEDEFFGKQEIYRERFYVSIPYTVSGEKPENMQLTVKSQGCADIGLCYPPQEWVELVTFRKPIADTPKLDFNALAGGGMGEFPPPDEVFFPDIFPVDGNTVEVGIQIRPGFYVYKEKIEVRSLSPDAQAGRLDLPKGKMKVDESFGEMEVYLEDVIGKLAIARATPDAMDLELELTYQGCAEGGLCYMPQTKVFTVSLPEATTVTDLTAVPDAGAPISQQDKLAKMVAEANIWAVLATFFGLGLLLALTPCVLPMVPILSSIIAGEGTNTSPSRGFTLAFSYVLGMSIVYTIAGLIAVAASAQVQAAFNQPWVLIIFAGIFVLLAVAMFGGYDLQMPSGIQSRLATISGNQKSGTTIGAFVMGALSSLIVTACVGPALIGVLLFIAQTDDMVRGGLVLFAMSWGMGAPLLAMGAAQGHLLPKAGPWMVAIKHTFGFMLLALAIWMLSRFLPGVVTLALWGVLIFMIGVFLGGLTTLTTESSGAQKVGKGFGFLSILYGLVLLFGALTGGDSLMKPLASVELQGSAGVSSSSHDELPFVHIKTVDDLDREIAAAAARGQSVMLDFYADWCVSCIEMEKFTFPDSSVQSALSNTVWLQADVTKNDEQDKALLNRFGVFGPPTIIFFGTDGIQRRGYEVVGYMKAKDFAGHVEKALLAPAPPPETTT